MSLNQTTQRNVYIGTGSVSIYAFTYMIFSHTDLVLTKKDTNDVETVLVKDVDYTVQYDTSDRLETGGTITLTVALPLNYTLVIERIVPLTQSTSFRNQSSFYPETHEDAFDKAMMVSQQQQDDINRSVKLPTTIQIADFDPTLPASITAAASANKLLAVNAASDGFALVTDQTGSGGGGDGNGVWPTTVAGVQTTGFTAAKDTEYPLNASGGAFAVTIPSAATAGNGKMIVFKKINTSTNLITLNRSGSDTLDGLTSLYIRHDYEMLALQSDGISKWHAVVKHIDIDLYPTGVAATDTANLQALFDRVDAGGGRTIRLGPGTFVVNATLTYEWSATNAPMPIIYGHGMETTYIRNEITSAAGFTMRFLPDADFLFGRGLVIRDIGFEGPVTAVPNRQGGIDLTAILDAEISNNKFEYFDGLGIRINNDQGNGDNNQSIVFSLHHNIFTYIDEWAIDLGAQATAMFDIQNNQIGLCGGGIRGKPINGTIQNNSISYSQRFAGCRIDSRAGATSRHFSIGPNLFEGNVNGDERIYGFCGKLQQNGHNDNMVYSLNLSTETTAESVSAPSSNLQTLTDAQASFRGGRITSAHKIRIAGSTDPNNNGDFPIDGVLSPTTLRFVNAAGSAKTEALSYTILAVPETDCYGVQFGDQFAALTGTGDSLSAPVYKWQTLTDSAGSFTAAMNQATMLISGAVNAVNNGDFIFVYVSATVGKIFNPLGVSETSSFSWSMGKSASANDTYFDNFVIIGARGTAESVSAPSGTTQTLTDAQAAFRSGTVSGAHTITISGSTDANNNGTFPLIDAPGLTTIRYTNAAGSAKTEAITWQLNAPTWYTRATSYDAFRNGDGSDYNKIRKPNWQVFSTAHAALVRYDFQGTAVVPEVEDNQGIMIQPAQMYYDPGDITAGGTYTPNLLNGNHHRIDITTTSAVTIAVPTPVPNNQQKFVIRLGNGAGAGNYLDVTFAAGYLITVGDLQLPVDSAAIELEFAYNAVGLQWYLRNRIYHSATYTTPTVVHQKDPGDISTIYGYATDIKLGSYHRLDYAMAEASFAGVGDSITFAAGSITIVDAGANFLADCVGRNIVILNATNAGNNGTWAITSRTSSTEIVATCASGVTETSSFQWDIPFKLSNPSLTPTYNGFPLKFRIANGTNGTANIANFRMEFGTLYKIRDWEEVPVNQACVLETFFDTAAGVYYGHQTYASWNTKEGSHCLISKDSSDLVSGTLGTTPTLVTGTFVTEDKTADWTVTASGGKCQYKGRYPKYFKVTTKFDVSSDVVKTLQMSMSQDGGSTFVARAASDLSLAAGYSGVMIMEALVYMGYNEYLEWFINVTATTASVTTYNAWINITEQIT